MTFKTVSDTDRAGTADTANLTASLTDANGNVVSSNALAVTFANPNPNAGNTTGSVINTLNSPYTNNLLFNPSLVPNQHGYYYHTVDINGGNDTINGNSGPDVIDAGNGNNLISGNGGQDIITTGNGNNQIYANAPVDLATALAQQKSATASGLKGDFIAVGNGNNTIVGGNGNDAISTGTGNNTIVCGAGAVTVMGGVLITLEAANDLVWRKIA